MSESPTPPAETPHRLCPPKRRRWISLFMGVLLLLSGVAIGVSATLIIAYHRVVYVLHHPEDVPSRLVYRMDWQYGLDEEQEERLTAIFTEAQEELVRMRDEDYPRVTRLLNEAKNAAMEVLDEEDREHFSERFEDTRDALVPPPTTEGLTVEP